MNKPLPDDLLSALNKVTGFDAPSFIQTHQDASPITSVRINKNKIFNFSNSVLTIDEKVSWSSSGFYLTHRPSFTLDPLFHGGAYYVQEASSMFLEVVIKQSCDLQNNIKVLDLCAAPGGKSTLIQSLISKDSLLVCNEVIKTRVNVLIENITKWGNANVVISNNDPKDFQRLPNYFDLIVVDAPCSGSGLFRKDPEAINEWSIENVSLCHQRQQRILTDVLTALKPGGTLIYSTCSYSYEENESITDWLVNNHDVESINIQLEEEWNIIETKSKENNCFGYRFYPNKLKGEGFFIAAFQKKKTSELKNDKKTKPDPDLLKKADLAKLEKYFEPVDNCQFFYWKNDIIAIPFNLMHEISILQSTLYIKKAGLNIGSLIRDELLPSHDLALNTLLHQKIRAIEVNKETALDYLRLHDIKISGTEIGWHIIKYRGVSLGLIKVLHNRINNYYPKEWRIVHK